MNSTNQNGPLLEVRNLSKHFGAVRALNDFSMAVRPGEVVALACDNGAGKTTLIKAISGVFQPTGGEIRRAMPEHRKAWPPLNGGQARRIRAIPFQFLQSK